MVSRKSYCYIPMKISPFWKIMISTLIWILNNESCKDPYNSYPPRRLFPCWKCILVVTIPMLVGSHSESLSLTAAIIISMIIITIIISQLWLLDIIATFCGFIALATSCDIPQVGCWTSSADMANMAEFSGFVSSKMRATLQVFIDWFTTWLL